MKFDPGLDLVWVRSPIGEDGIDLGAGHHPIRGEFSGWISDRSEVVDPHRDLPHVRPSDQTGATAGRTITEGGHRMLVAACSLLGVAAQAIRQALASRAGAEAETFSEAIIEAD
jgi:hypothetical protein